MQIDGAAVSKVDGYPAAPVLSAATNGTDLTADAGADG